MIEDLKKELVQRITRNLLGIQVLRLINAQPMWGYMIKKQAEAKFGIRLRHGALYPLLNSLEQKGLLTGQRQRQKGRTRKTYTITAEGQQYLVAYQEALKEQIRGKDLK